MSGGHFTVLLDLDELMQPAFPRTVSHQAAGVFIDDLHLPIHDEIILVPFEKVQGGKCLGKKLFTSLDTHPLHLICFRLFTDLIFPVIGEFQRSALPVNGEIP